MRRSTAAAVLASVPALFLAVTSAGAQPADPLIRANAGVILDAPFLLQEELPFESRYHGAYGDELVTYEYDEAGMPAFIRYVELEGGTLYMEVEPGYRPDGQLRAVTYRSYDETGEELLYVDRFEFAAYTATGPSLGVMTTDDGIVAEMRLTYDEAGRIVGLEEDDPYGEGFFRRERYVWAGEGAASVPYAKEIIFPLDGEIERFRYLYDAEGLLRAAEGVNILQSDPDDPVLIDEWFAYRSRTLDDVFGRIRPSATEPQSTASR